MKTTARYLWLILLMARAAPALTVESNPAGSDQRRAEWVREMAEKAHEPRSVTSLAYVVDRSPGAVRPYSLPAYPDTFYVRPDGTGEYPFFPSIQAAIDAVTDPTTIVLANGVYSGEGNRDIDTKGKVLLITSESQDPSVCTIELDTPYSRGFVFQSSESNATVIANITINSTSVLQVYGGGGVKCVNASPTLYNCVIHTAVWWSGGGGGLFSHSGALLVGCSINGWTMEAAGGGLYIGDSSEVSIQNCAIGGRSYEYYGGGIACNASTLIITDSEFSGGRAGDGFGGAMSLANSTISITGSVFANNTAHAISAATSRGGAIYAASCSLTMSHCTLFANTVETQNTSISRAGSSIAATASEIFLTNTVVAFGSGGQEDGAIAAYLGSNISLVNCDIFGNPGGDYTGLLLPQLGVTGNISADPLFCDGALGRVTLDAASPCLLLAVDKNGEPDYIGARGMDCVESESVPMFIQAEGGVDAGLRSGAAWGDYDGDGDDDLYVVRYNATSQLYRNDGGGVFVNIITSPLAVVGPGRSAAWGDYDGDGDLDIFVVNDGAPNRLFKNVGGSLFLEVAETALAISGPNRDAVWADLDNDGDVDLYLIRYGASNYLFRNDGGTFSRALCPALEDDGPSVTAALGDIDRDGDLDVYIVNAGTANRLVRNDGGLAFANISMAPLDLSGDNRGAIWGDFDNDGDLDLYATTHSSGNHLLRNDGPEGFTDITEPNTRQFYHCVGATWLDYDRDADLDLYVMTEGANVLLRNDIGSFIPVPGRDLNVDGAGVSAAAADYDRDGRVDLFFADDIGTAETSSLVRNESSGINNWISISLRGTESNSFGVGAWLAAYDGGVCIVHHEIGGGSSPAVQSSLTMTVGLGRLENGEIGARAAAAATIDSLKISWPGGIVQVLRNVPVDTKLVIHELAGPQPSFPGWQMHQRDMYHTGRADFTVPTARLNGSFFDLFNWQTPAPDSPLNGNLGATSMVFADGVGPNGTDIVVGGYHWPKGVQGMDRHTGEVFWAGLPNGGESIGDRSPAFAPDGQSIYVTNDATDWGEYPNGRPLMAFATAVGPAIFRHNGADTVPGHLERTNPVISPDGRVFLHRWWQRPHAGTDNGTTIHETWAAQTHLDCLGVDVSLYQDSNLCVVAGGQYSGVASYDGTTGAELWRVATPSVYATVTIDPATGNIYVPGGEGDISIIGLNRLGQPLWGEAARLCYDGSGDPQRAFSTGCLSHDGGTYYFQTSGQAAPSLLYAINTATGAVKWTYPTGSIGWDNWSVSCPIVTRNGVIVVGNNEGDTYFALKDDGVQATLLDTLPVEAAGNARASATISADGHLYLPLRTTWTVPGGSMPPSGEAANLFCSLDLVSDQPFFGSYSTDFDSEAVGQTQPHPGSPNQGGWFQVTSVGAGTGEIQGDIAMSGNALHEHAPASNPAGTPTGDGLDLVYSLVGSPHIVLSADFYAHGSSPTAINPYTASLTVNGGPHPGYQIIGFGVGGGNDVARGEGGCHVSVDQYNGIDNNELVELTVGQALSWDAWHHVEVAIDHGSGKYLYVEVDGQRQYLAATLLPRSELDGVWRRGERIDRINSEIVSIPWAWPNQTDDDIYWDNVELRIVDATASEEMPLAFVPLSLRVVPNPFNATATVEFELGAAAEVSVRVYDVRGRLVQDLQAGRLGAGQQRVRWDGRDGQGAPAAAGVYLILVATRDGQVSATRTALIK